MNSTSTIITYHIDDDDGVLAKATRALVEVWLVQLEGGHVRREDGRVDHQYQYQPIPSGLPKSYNSHINLHYALHSVALRAVMRLCSESASRH